MSGASRQKLGGGNRNYDRSALFADTRESVRCFAVMNHFATEFFVTVSCVDNMTNPKSGKCGCFHYDRSTTPITI